MPDEVSAQPTDGAQAAPAPAPAPEPAQPAEQPTPPVEVPAWVTQPVQPPQPPPQPYVPPQPQYMPQQQYVPQQQYAPQPQYQPPSFDDLVNHPEIVDQRAAMAVAPVVQRLAQLDQFARQQFESTLGLEEAGARQAIYSGYQSVVSKDPAYANPVVKQTVDSLLQAQLNQAIAQARMSGDFSGLRSIGHKNYMPSVLAVAKVHAGYPGGQAPGPIQVQGAMVESSRSAPAPSVAGVEIDDDLRAAARRMGLEPEVLAKKISDAEAMKKKLGWESK